MNVTASSYTDQIVSSPVPSDEFGELRTRALTSLKQLGLPAGKAEEYRFTPVTRFIEKNFASWPVAAPGHADVDVKPYLVPGTETYVVVTINGVLQPGLSTLPAVGTSCRAISSKDSITGTQLDFSRDAFAALNTAFWQGGVEIDVEPDTTLDKPILLINITDARAGVVSVHNRLSVRVGENASVTLIQRSIQLGDERAFTTTGEEILVLKGAACDYTKIQNDPKALHVTLTNIRQLDQSRVNTFTLTTDGKLVRNNLTIAIDGEQCESHFHGLYLLKGDTHADNHTVVDHRKPNSFSNELYKGVMDDNAKGVFNGKIYVRPDAQKTNAFQSNRNILLTDKATINTKPQLEIWADDVKCSHGCTTGQLDEEAMFYLQSRGISQDFARAMLLSAFAGETLELVSNESLKAYLSSIVALRLNGASS